MPTAETASNKKKFNVTEYHARHGRTRASVALKNGAWDTLRALTEQFKLSQSEVLEALIGMKIEGEVKAALDGAVRAKLDTKARAEQADKSWAELSPEERLAAIQYVQQLKGEKKDVGGDELAELEKSLGLATG